MDFSSLICLLKWKKKWHSMFVKIFQVSFRNLLSFQLKTFLKLVLATWLACARQNILMSQLRLHTLKQTCLSANQSMRTILVI